MRTFWCDDKKRSFRCTKERIVEFLRAQKEKEEKIKKVALIGELITKLRKKQSLLSDQDHIDHS